MNTLTANDSWRPKPWVAALLGLFFGGAGLLYVQRPWWALAAYCAPWVLVLGTLYAIWNFDLYINLDLLLGIGWAVAIVCAVYAFRVARATNTGIARKWYSRWPVLGAVFLATYAVVVVIRAFVFEPFRVPSQSMHPTVPEGAWVFVLKPGFGPYAAFGITLWSGTPTARIERGDIIVHRLVMDPATSYLGRIVGLPGDRVEYTNHRLVINGNAVPLQLGSRDETYQYAVERLDGREVTIAFLPQRFSRDWAGVVPPDHYLVFGDSRDNSRDSRFPEIGFIPRDHIVGRVVKIVKEPNRS
jgi:signal peptidase I